MRSAALFLGLTISLSAQVDNLTGRFTAMGAGTAAQISAGVLTLTYPIEAKHFAAAVTAAPPSMARMRRIRLRVKSDHSTAIAVLLREKPPGGNYTAAFWAPAGTWQQVELTTADFTLSDGPQDPRDPDGKLDLDSIAAIGVLDVAQIFLALPEDSEVPLTVDRAAGQHTLLIDNFEVIAGGPAEKPLRTGAIDAFDRGFLQWLTPGGLDLKCSASGNPLGAAALEITSREPEGTVALVTRRISNLNLSGISRLAFDVASEQEATIVLSLEQRDGKRFNLTVYPPGAKEIFHVTLRLQDFEGPGRIDAAQLKTLSIGDLTGQGNKMWIANLRGER
jgi:hypothetical protein